jgi:hypothetical protein
VYRTLDSYIAYIAQMSELPPEYGGDFENSEATSRQFLEVGKQGMYIVYAKICSIFLSLSLGFSIPLYPSDF